MHPRQRLPFPQFSFAKLNPKHLQYSSSSCEEFKLGKPTTKTGEFCDSTGDGGGGGRGGGGGGGGRKSCVCSTCGTPEGCAAAIPACSCCISLIKAACSDIITAISFCIVLIFSAIIKNCCCCFSAWKPALSVSTSGVRVRMRVGVKNRNAMRE